MTTRPTGTPKLDPVVVDVTVRVPIETAFRAFVTDFHRWWPAGHHLGEEDPELVAIEPRVGGRWFERSPSGEECEWGEVLAWEPPHRVLLAWNLDGTWSYRPGLENASHVDITFTALEPGVTRVVLEHGRLEVHGDTAVALRDGVRSERGWPLLVTLYAGFVEARVVEARFVEARVVEARVVEGRPQG